jgi:hypothetical protein
MATSAEDVLKDALQLSEGERARVAAELLASLEPDIETRDGEAWVAEVERRAQAAVGGLPGLSWGETRTSWPKWSSGMKANDRGWGANSSKR